MANTISNMGDVIDSRDVIARIEELKEQVTDRWVAGWNMPGFMPDNEPAEFDSFEGARDYIEHEIERYTDELAGSDNSADELLFKLLEDDLKAAAYSLESMEAQEFGQTICGYHYFITQDGQMGLDEEEQEELEKLEELASEGADYSPDWTYGSTLIRDSYFKEYAMELAEDCGMINREVSWPYTCIDWERAADYLKMDYTRVSFAGVAYWVR